VSEWRRIEDGPPEGSYMCWLAVTTRSGARFAVQGYWESGGWWEVGGSSLHHRWQVTHWQPLLPPVLPVEFTPDTVQEMG